ncbi:hypothetical protein D3C72_2425170 [compost metagenome]
MSGQAFRADLEPWERLARLADAYGPDRERVLLELKADLKLAELPADLLQGVDYFMAGAK